MGPRPAEKAIESSSTFYGKGGIGLSPRASSRGSLLPKHANGIGRGYKWRVVVRCYGYPEDLSFFVSRSWKLNDSRERERERDGNLSLLSFFLFYHQGNIPVWRGWLARNESFQSKISGKRKSCECVSTFDWSSFFYFFVPFFSFSPSPVGMGIASIQNYLNGWSVKS